MPALIVPGIVRYAIKGEYAGQQIANIIDIDIDSIGIEARETNVQDQAEVLVSAWADHICPQLSSTYRANEIDWVDMNSASGSTGTQITGTGSDFPQVGGIAGTPMPGSVAYLIHKAIQSQRGARAGRMYLVGMAESDTAALTPNEILGARVTAMNTALASFLAAVNQDGGNYNSRIKVVHTKNNALPTEPPDIVYVSQSEVTSLTCDNRVRSQRRRLP